jgi:hypothetical protein
VSVNRVTPIPTTAAAIQTVNYIGEQESQPEGIKFSDLNDRITLQDFAENDKDEDSNASDDDFKLDDEYQEEVDNEIALEEKEGSIGNNDPDSQEDYFQTAIQQHNTNVSNNNEPASVILQENKRGNNPNSIVTLNNTVTPGTQKCAKQKKRNTIDQDALVEEDMVDVDHIASENDKPAIDDIDVKADDIVVDNELATPHELESDLGPYWTLVHSCKAYVLSTIT